MPDVDGKELNRGSGGGPGESMFFIFRGTVACLMDGKELNRLGPGDCFGEVALIERIKVGPL